MANKIQGIDYETALANLRASSLKLAQQFVFFR